MTEWKFIRAILFGHSIECIKWMSSSSTMSASVSKPSPWYIVPWCSGNQHNNPRFSVTFPRVWHAGFSMRFPLCQNDYLKKTNAMFGQVHTAAWVETCFRNLKRKNKHIMRAGEWFKFDRDFGHTDCNVCVTRGYCVNIHIWLFHQSVTFHNMHCVAVKL